MRPMLKSLKRALYFPKEYRRRFFGYLALGLTPLLIITLATNLYFLQLQMADSAKIVHSASTQACSQISSLYDMSINLAQNTCVHTNLQDGVLSTYGKSNDYQVLNRNFLKLQALVNSYTLFDELMDVRFYLPTDLAVPNGSTLMYPDKIEQEAWYAEYLVGGNILRWYLADRVQDSGAQDVLCAVRPIQDPMNYSCIVGYLRVDVRLDKVQEIISDSCIMDDTSCFLVDRDQGVIWHAGPMPPERFCEADGVKTAFDSVGPEYVRVGAQRYLISRHSVPSSTMALVYLVPQMSLTKDLLMNCMLQIVLFLLELVLVTLITAVFSSSLLSSRNNQLRLLNYQINPHFLYNTLDMINWQAINQNMPDIYRPIQALSRFYKITLNHGSDFIRVADEVEHIRLYIELQNIRFKNGISYRIEADPGIRDCFILHMVLQPLVENSVLHGILEKDSQSGSILVSAREESGQLVFVIADDGVGMDGTAAKELLRGSSSVGYGLSNIQQRIHLYYGKRFGLSIDSTPGKGTTVWVTMPCIRQEPQHREL